MSFNLKYAWKDCQERLFCCRVYRLMQWKWKTNLPCNQIQFFFNISKYLFARLQNNDNAYGSSCNSHHSASVLKGFSFLLPPGAFFCNSTTFHCRKNLKGKAELLKIETNSKLSSISWQNTMFWFTFQIKRLFYNWLTFDLKSDNLGFTLFGCWVKFTSFTVLTKFIWWKSLMETLDWKLN